MQQMIPVYLPNLFGSEATQQTKTWFINMIVPAQKTLMVASLDGAEYALLDSGSGLTSCPINYANDIPLLPRPAGLPILSNATGGSVEYIGQRHVGYRLENGEPFIAKWHVANVTNLIISTESITGANIEVRHAKNESSMIMDRSGTRTSVLLHRFAKLPWLKLRRDISVLDSDLRIAAVSTGPMAIEEIDSEEERQACLRKKRKRWEWMGPWRFAKHMVQVPQIRSLSQLRHRQRSAQHPILVLWSDEPCGVLEPAQEESEARGKRSHRSERSGESHARALTHKFPKLVQLLRASKRRQRPTSQTTMQRTRVPDHHGRLLFFAGRTRQGAVHHPAHVGHCTRHDGGNQRGGKEVGCIRSLGGGRTFASMETEEGDLPHRWRTGNPCTGRWQCNTPEAKKLSSSVDPSIPHHQWVRLRTRTRNSVLLHEKA